MEYKEYLEQAEKRNNEIVGMRKAGLSYNKIGEKYNISRQRVMEILKKYAPKQDIPLDNKN